MELIGFKDYCVVERDAIGADGDAVYDENDEPIRNIIYEGNCLYQEGGVNASEIISQRPTVYLPENAVMIEINDVVKVTTEVGRKIEALVGIPRDVKFDMFDSVNITKLELKQALGS